MKHHEKRGAVGSRTHADDRGLDGSESAHDEFGGINWGACFFGWLAAVGVSLLLSGIIGALASAVGSSGAISQSQAEREAGTIGAVAAIVVLLVLVVGYYAGGYVAGRMSRFDGGRQGLGVWLIGLIVTIICGVAGAALGSQFNVLNQVNLPNIPVSGEQASWGALIAAAAVLLITAVAAMLGGRVGHRYHNRVDTAALR